MLPPSRSSPTCHCHSDPDSQIKPSRKTPGLFGQLNTKTLPEAATKHTPAFECRERRDAGERLRRALTPPLPFIPAPAPTQRQQLQFSLRLPRRQKLKTRFHWSTAWISWIPLLPAFSAFPGVNTVKPGGKGMGRAIGKAATLCHPSDHGSPKTDWRHLQWGCNKGLFLN